MYSKLKIAFSIATSVRWRLPRGTMILIGVPRTTTGAVASNGPAMNASR